MKSSIPLQSTPTSQHTSNHPGPRNPPWWLVLAFFAASLMADSLQRCFSTCASAQSRKLHKLHTSSCFCCVIENWTQKMEHNRIQNITQVCIEICNMTFSWEILIFQQKTGTHLLQILISMFLPQPSIPARSRKGVIVAMATTSMRQPVRGRWHDHHHNNFKG